MKVCFHCGDELEYVKGRGWIHKRTGTMMVKQCLNCYELGPDQDTCPKCGSDRYIDHHCALPVHEEILKSGEGR